MSGYIDWQHLNYIILYRLVYGEKVCWREWYRMVFSTILRIAHFSFSSCSHLISFYCLKIQMKLLINFVAIFQEYLLRRCVWSSSWLDVQTMYSHQDFSSNLMSKFTSSFEIWGKKFFQRWQAQVLWDDEGMTLVPSNI